MGSDTHVLPKGRFTTNIKKIYKTIKPIDRNLTQMLMWVNTHLLVLY